MNTSAATKAGPTKVEQRTGRKIAALLVALHAAGAKLKRASFQWVPPLGITDPKLREAGTGKVAILYTWSPPAGAAGANIDMQVRELRERNGSFYVTMPGRMNAAKHPGDYEWHVGPLKVKALQCYLDDLTLRVSKLTRAQ
jgi:hypothetical protein